MTPPENASAPTSHAGDALDTAGPTDRDMSAGRTLLDAAIAYAARGWYVVPLHSIGPDGRCTCAAPDSDRVCDAETPAPGKHPRTPRGEHDATIDEPTIRKWWTRWPDSNVGIVLEPSGLVVLDVDVGKGKRGAESLAAIDAALPPTLTARTGSGGLHAIYSRPDGVVPSRKIGTDKTTHPGLDLLGRGYVVAAPSRHVSGGQ